MRRATIALAAAGALVVACQVVAGIDHVAKVSATTSTEAGVPANDPCGHVFAPPQPLTDDAKDVTLPPFWLAVRSLTLTPKATDGSYTGIDLDSVCTCDHRAGTAQEGQSSCTPKQDVCDYDGGVDNRGAALFDQFVTLNAPNVNDSINADIGAGRSGLLIWIADWNGKPNDLEVHVGALVTSGITSPDGCGNTTTDDTVHYHPGWCGHDRWDHAPNTTLTYNENTQPLSTTTGYVANGQLVFRSSSPINFAVGMANVPFNSPIAFGKLEASGTGYKLTGLLGGRLEIGALLGAIGQFAIAKTPLCQRPEFIVVRQELCNAVDIARSNVFDFQNAACDAVSSVMQYTAEPAELGNEVPQAANPSPCAPGIAGNDAKYTCP